MRDFNPDEISPGEFGADRSGTSSGRRRASSSSTASPATSIPCRSAQGRGAGHPVAAQISCARRRADDADRGSARLIGENVGLDVDVSFLGDTVLLLRIRETEGRLRRSITVVKKRQARTTSTSTSFIIASSGVTVVPYNPLPEPADRARPPSRRAGRGADPCALSPGRRLM